MGSLDRACECTSEGPDDGQGRRGVRRRRSVEIVGGRRSCHTTVGASCSYGGVTLSAAKDGVDVTGGAVL